MPPLVAAMHFYNASPADAPALHAMLRELAEFEGLEGAPPLSVEQLAADIAAGHCWCILVSAEPGAEPCAYALGYTTYCTWEGRGLYLEDLFVRPSMRSRGIGLQLISAVAKRALATGCARLQWQSLDWNSRAFDFYMQKVGATEFKTDGGRTDGRGRWLNLILQTSQMVALQPANGD